MNFDFKEDYIDDKTQQIALNKTINERITWLMSDLDYSLKEFSRRGNISTKVITTNNPRSTRTLYTLYNIGTAFNTGIDFLTGISNTPGYYKVNKPDLFNKNILKNSTSSKCEEIILTPLHDLTSINSLLCIEPTMTRDKRLDRLFLFFSEYIKHIDK